MKEMSDLICDKAAVGGNYNSTHDNMESVRPVGSEQKRRPQTDQGCCTGIKVISIDRI